MIVTVNEVKKRFNLEDRFATIISDGTWATVSQENHNFKDGDFVEIFGTTNFNGIHNIKRVSPMVYKFRSTEVVSTPEDAVINQSQSEIELIIAQVEDFVKNYCGITYGDTASKVEVYDFPKDGMLMINRGNINKSTVTKVELTKDQYVTVEETTDYIAYPQHIQLNTRSEYSGWKQAVRVTYSTEACPQGLKALVMKMIVYEMHQLNDKSENKENYNRDGDSVTYSKKYPPEILDQLEGYKRLHIGTI